MFRRAPGIVTSNERLPLPLTIGTPRKIVRERDWQVLRGTRPTVIEGCAHLPEER